MTSQTLVIDSYDRIEGTSTAFRINLNQVKENIESIQLVSAVIPNTSYNVYNYTINGILYQNKSIRSKVGEINFRRFFCTNDHEFPNVCLCREI